AQHRLLVHADKERTRLDAALSQPSRQPLRGGTRFPSPEHAVHPAHARRPRLLYLQLDRFEIAQAFGIRQTHATFARDDVVGARELRHPEGRLQVGQLMVVAKLVVHEATWRREAEIAQLSSALCLL